MAIRQTQRWCRTCRARTMHAKEVFGAEWGCLLTALTGCIFLPIWILADAIGIVRPFRCQTCGAKAGSTVSQLAGAAVVCALAIYAPLQVAWIIGMGSSTSPTTSPTADARVPAQESPAVLIASPPAVASAQARPDAEWRTWTDASGKHQTEARLKVATAGSVTIVRRDNKEVTIPIEKLSKSDQDWLASQDSAR
jgi:hypothetical protein